MALDGLNIATRTGDGEAGIFNDGGLLNLYGNLLAKQQQRKQQEQQMLANELASVRSDGLRNDADRQVFFNKYNDIKNIAAQVPYEKNNWAKAKLNAQVQQGLKELDNYAQRSKQQGANESDWSKSYMARPELWDDAALAAAQASKKAALDSDGIISDFTTLQRKPNVDKINKDLSSMVKANLASQRWQDQITKGTEGNKTGVFVNSSRQVNTEGLYHGAANYYDISHDFQRHLQTLYPDAFNTDNPTQAKANAIKQYVDDAIASKSLGATTETKPQKFNADWKPDKPDRYYEHKLWDLAHKQGTQGQPTYFQDLSERIRGGDDSARQEFGKIFENNPAYLNGVHFDVRDPKAVKVTIPAKYSTDVSKISKDDKGRNIPNSERKLVQQAHTYTLDSTNPVQWTTALSQIYSNATGERAAAPSKTLTPNAKGKVPGGKQVTIVDNANSTVQYNGKHYSKDAVSRAAKASGLSVEEYLKAIAK